MSTFYLPLLATFQPTLRLNLALPLVHCVEDSLQLA